MIVIYHIESRQSERVVWLLEELGVDYELPSSPTLRLLGRRRMKPLQRVVVDLTSA